MPRARFLRTDVGAALAKSISDDDENALAEQVDHVMALIKGNTLDTDLALGAIIVLQEDRRFAEIVDVAEAVVTRDSFKKTPTELLRRYCQALIERRSLTGADCVLLSLTARIEAAKSSELETRSQKDDVLSLRARIAKQRYVTFSDERDLQSSIRLYSQAYDLSRGVGDNDAAIWHGGNLLALLHVAERRGIMVGKSGLPTPDQLRAWLDSTIGENLNVLNVFSRGTKIETLVAGGGEADLIAASEIANGLATAEYATAFELASVRRQLLEVWGLAYDDPIIQQLDSANLSLGPRSHVVLDRSEGLEKLLSHERPIVHATLERGLFVARSVCMIVDRAGGPIGTGFLLPGSELSASLGDELVLLTNHHVVTTEPGERDIAPPTEVRARFELTEDADGTPIEIDGLQEIWTSAELDATVLRLKVPGIFSDSPIKVASAPPAKTGPQSYVYVAGHPLGQRLSLSIRGNSIIEVGETLLHYMAPTEPGSSGSPVFDPAFDLVGLHHAGSLRMPTITDPKRRHPANEAISIFAIRAAIGRQEAKGDGIQELVRNTVAAIRGRLGGLSEEDLAGLRSLETAGQNRKTVIASIDSERQRR